MSYGLYIGRNHTADGIAYLAGYGDEPSSHWLEIMPDREHPPGAEITVGVTRQAQMPGQLSRIPQAAKTARHLRVSYSHYLGVPAPLTNGGLNEFGVAVRDIWSPSRPELVALTPQDQSGPNYSDLARIVLERATSASEGVDIISRLIGNHGYSCYGGNSHLIADADEAWVVIEFSGGLGLWVAERLGPNSIRASRPGHIGTIPPEPNADYRFPPHFIPTAIKQGWYEEASGSFNVNRVYGDGKGAWAGVQWIEQEIRVRASRPDKIGLADVFWAISTEKLTGDTAGYGQVVPLLPESQQSRRMMWHAPVGPVTAPMMPVFMRQHDVPLEYGPHRYLTEGEAARFLDSRHAGDAPDSVSHVPQGVEVSCSAVQIFKRLMHLAFQGGLPILAEVWEHWRAMEATMIAELPDIFASAEILEAAGRSDLASRLLSEHSGSRLLQGLEEAEKLAVALEVRLRRMGMINKTVVPRGPEQIW